MEIRQAHVPWHAAAGSLQLPSITMAIDEDNLSDTERAICEAIWGLRVIEFISGGRPRIAEPHDFGVIRGERRLFYYQVGGASSAGPPLGWRWASSAEMLEIQLLERRFSGPRPTPSGRHHRWDRLMASVSRPTGLPVTISGRRQDGVRREDTKN
jgi:hypothetical protein